jgi:ubiquinone/menaquinone biosynthesis C-methylase UbiE
MPDHAEYNFEAGAKMNCLDRPNDLAEQLVLVCPNCRQRLQVTQESAICTACNQVYPVIEDGYLDLTPRSGLGALGEEPATPEDYVHEQHCNGERLLEEFFKPLIAAIRPRNALDVGCGAGELVKQLQNEGVECYGIDLPSNAKHWGTTGINNSSVFGADARHLPFGDNSFDLVMSLGVIEHIGTINGHCTLSTTYVADRQRYAKEIVRVTKSNGSILIAAPNKSFPVDIQHGPTDAVGPKAPIRSFICNKTGLNLHKTWGHYHLPSYAEVKGLFLNHAGASAWEALPLHGYFGFGRFRSGFLKPFAMLAQAYVERLPKSFLNTGFNPYVLVRITK